jgi:hypothetical protein
MLETRSRFKKNSFCQDWIFRSSFEAALATSCAVFNVAKTLLMQESSSFLGPQLLCEEKLFSRTDQLVGFH